MKTTEVGGMGFAPKVTIRPYTPNPEIARYEKVWEKDEYREVAPGEQIALTFLQQARVTRDAECIDFGCGTGRGALMLAALGGLRVTMVDFAKNCLDKEVAEACVTQPDRLKFIVRDLNKTMPFHAPYGYCVDVMEHVPTEDVSKVLRNILGSAHHVFFCIALFDDLHGRKFGIGPLHLTVKPAVWWLDQLRSLGAVIHWSASDVNRCMVYCSNWKDATEVLVGGKINVTEEIVDAQVVANVNAGWQHVVPRDKQNREVVLLAGGPSLAGQLDEIKKLRAEGAGLVTVNGAYAWALEHGLEPSVQIVLDARAFNARFTRPITPYTKYLIGSQAHPSTLEGLPYEQTFLWHSGLTEANDRFVQDKMGYYFPVPGGSTVVLRAIPLLRMLGFWRLHLFGFDSCVTKEQHHAYAQTENDNEPLVPVTCGDRMFECTPWMLSQASEFRDIVKFMGDEVELAVYGDGLIANMVSTGAVFSTQQKE
jgi:SAM-dependent methyltransferase